MTLVLYTHCHKRTPATSGSSGETCGSACLPIDSVLISHRAIEYLLISLLPCPLLAIGSMLVAKRLPSGCCGRKSGCVWQRATLTLGAPKRHICHRPCPTSPGQVCHGVGGKASLSSEGCGPAANRFEASPFDSRPVQVVWQHELNDEHTNHIQLAWSPSRPPIPYSAGERRARFWKWQAILPVPKKPQPSVAQADGRVQRRGPQTGLLSRYRAPFLFVLCQQRLRVWKGLQESQRERCWVSRERCELHRALLSHSARFAFQCHFE
mmetsp:Transcript_149150/g.260097  ORF Transcript_149150/g.260097 Transcript_149150/m.260097 type:complete len:266 (+) Transcript_149150:838-1635(+)